VRAYRIEGPPEKGKMKVRTIKRNEALSPGHHKGKRKTRGEGEKMRRGLRGLRGKANKGTSKKKYEGRGREGGRKGNIQGPPAGPTSVGTRSEEKT